MADDEIRLPRTGAERARDRRWRPAPAELPARPAARRPGPPAMPGTTTRAAAPPNSPRTSPKQRAPGTKTRSPTRAAGARPDLAHAAHRLVARHQRIAHAGERRHAAGPEQSLGARADAAPLDVDHDVPVTRTAPGRAGRARAAQASPARRQSCSSVVSRALRLRCSLWQSLVGCGMAVSVYYDCLSCQA